MRFWLTALCLSIVLPAALSAFANDVPKSKREIEFDPDWTPRPVEGDAPGYVKETDIDWIDDRLRKMDTGRTWNATFRYAESGLTPNPDALPDDEAPKVRTHRSFKGTAIRIGENGNAGVIFDRNQCRWTCAWTGDFLWHNDRRFGLLNTPQPAGKVKFSTKADAGWSKWGEPWSAGLAATGPLPPDVAHFEGMYCHGDRTVLRYRVGDTTILESPWIEHHGEYTVFTRTFRIDAHAGGLECLLCSVDFKFVPSQTNPGGLFFKTASGWASATLIGNRHRCNIGATGEGRVILQVPESKVPRVVKVAFIAAGDVESPRPPDSFFESVTQLSQSSKPAAGENFDEWTSPGSTQWEQPLVTQGEVAEDDATLVIDTITVPYANPHNALFFVSGVDFLPTGELAVSTIHGDVWLVSGVDEDLDEIRWKRFATGLYQPLGLKVVDGQIYVLERGQLTRLHDYDGDGTADYYEAFNGDWHIGGGEHSFDTCLERDHQGNWYFHSTGDPKTPTGGTVMRISPDGRSSEVFCTGFRHPIGMGVLPDGRITGADQEGNWMPSTRIDIYRKGGFYGDMRAHHRDTPPEIYDGPLCWLPRQLDGSAGGQVAVPQGQWGPLGGRTLHMSFGNCRMMLLMMQQIGDVEQAGAVDLGLQFISGIQRGRFRPSDGHLYIVGMDGWQTATVVDGCLQRVRYTGKPFRTPMDLEVEPDGLQITFSTPLDREIAGTEERYQIEQWNYRWSEEYGSPRFSVANPDEEGQDVVPIESVSVSEDGHEVFLTVRGLQPVMQMQIDYRLADKSGETLDGVIYNTIHTTGR